MKSFFGLKTKPVSEMCSYFITYDNSFDFANIMESIQTFMNTNEGIIQHVRRVHIEKPFHFEDFHGSSFAIVFDVSQKNDELVLNWFKTIKEVPNPIVICSKYKHHMKKEILIENIK
jgi:hypothetical protein